MVLDIPANNLGRHFITDRADKIAIFPEFSAPQPTLEARELSKNGTSTQTFEAGHDLRNRVPRRKRAKNVDMIGTDFHLFDHDVVLERDISEELFHALLYVTVQDISAILGRPHQMILGVIDGMRRSSDNHVAILPSLCARISRH